MIISGIFAGCILLLLRLFSVLLRSLFIHRWIFMLNDCLFFVSLNTIWNKDCALGDNGDSRFSTALSGSGSFKPPALQVVPDSLPCRQNLWVDCSAPA